MPVLRRVWDGPFKTPPLEHPVTVGWVLLKIIETIWRAFLLLVVLAALVFAGAWISERNPLSSQVAVEVSLSATCSEKGFPVRAAFTNESRKTLGEIHFRFRVYSRGHSADVASYLGARHELKDIVRPGWGIAYCYPMPAVEPGATGPFTVAADVTYAAELSKDVPASAIPAPPPPMIVVKETGGVPKPKSIWTKVRNIIGALVGVALFASGGCGLLALADHTLKTTFQDRVYDNSKGEQGCVVVLLLGGLNAALVGVAATILERVGLGAWISDLDKWSRANGYSDAAMFLTLAVACQWPWVIWWLVPERKTSKDIERVS